MKTLDLVDALKEASAAYYNSEIGETLMTDEEFDLKVEELRKIDPDNEFLQTVGCHPIGQIFEHQSPIGSQEKLKTRDEFNEWCEKIITLSNEPDI